MSLFYIKIINDESKKDIMNIRNFTFADEFVFIRALGKNLSEYHAFVVCTDLERHINEIHVKMPEDINAVEIIDKAIEKTFIDGLEPFDICLKRNVLNTLIDYTQVKGLCKNNIEQFLVETANFIEKKYGCDITATYDGTDNIAIFLDTDAHYDEIKKDVMEIIQSGDTFLQPDESNLVVISHSKESDILNMDISSCGFNGEIADFEMFTKTLIDRPDDKNHVVSVNKNKSLIFVYMKGDSNEQV